MTPRGAGEGDPAAVHPSAAAGFASASQVYASGRPDYPAAADAWLRDAIGLGPGRTVLDLGAGTGKFLPYLECTGASVRAVEPVAAMRAELERHFPDVAATAGTAQAIPLPDAAVDAVVCAQSFHWFASEAALREIRRVLVPGGTLGLIWNVRDESVAWVSALSRITDPFESGVPRYRSGAWRRLFPAEGFAAIDERTARHAHVGTADETILARTMSVSFIAALAPPERAVVKRQVRRLIETDPALAGRAEIAFPYETAMFAFRKTAVARGLNSPSGTSS